MTTAQMLAKIDADYMAKTAGYGIGQPRPRNESPAAKAAREARG